MEKETAEQKRFLFQKELIKLQNLLKVQPASKSNVVKEREWESLKAGVASLPKEWEMCGLRP